MIKHDFKFEILDEDLKYIKTIYPDNCSIDYDSMSTLKLSINATIRDDNYNYNDKNLAIKSNDETVATALISTSAIDKHYKKRTLTCYDRCIILSQDKLTDSIVIPAFTNIVKYISDMLKEYDNAFSLIESNATNKADIFFKVGTSKIEVINYLLNLINYSSLLTDKHGVFYAQKYVLPSERDSEITYTDDINTSIIYRDVRQEQDLFNVPNVFVRVTNNTAIDPPLKAVYENDNPDSVASTASRGRRIVDFKEVNNVTDSETLFAITKKEAYQASDIYENIDIETSINTKHWYLNCITLNIQTYNINDKYIETSWSIDNLKAGGKMKHKMRRVINV
ncbi:MAG: hypothetical protein ACTTKD_06565 [Peptoanaerobacter stomatis]|uniref:hypothetical protein n=1 Tax=Peptoanaerobacter stomatis TaxID=796937 RepID=UPI003F9F0DFC